MGQIIAYIGLGSNLGDRAGMLSAAVHQLAETSGVRVVKRSATLETKPVGPVQDQPDFLNTVVQVETSRSASELLAVLQGIEKGLGRVRETRWGPRIIDLDILLYGDETIHTTDLHIPHPEIGNRPFVMSALRELGVA